MKKTTKKLLTFALATLFVGAGFGAVATFNGFAANVAVADANSMTKVDSAIKAAMLLEEGKVKKMDSWGYYDSDADGVADVWSVSRSANTTGAAEIRFSTPGTNTVPGSSDRTYNPMAFNSISVDYCINGGGTELAESSTTPYLLQILGAKAGTGSANQYYYHVPEIIADGEWHTLKIDLNSVFSGGSNESLPMNVSTFDDINDIVCCWNFKTGNDFVGEIMFKNFDVETTVDLANELYNINEHGNGDWGTCGDFGEAGLYRFWVDADKTINWANGVNCLNESHYDYLLDFIKINGRTAADWRSAYAAGETNKVTWTGMPENTGSSSGSGKYMQNNIAADVNAGNAIYAPIFFNLVKHGDLGSALDIYIPTSFIEKVESIEFLEGFVWMFEGQSYGFSEDVKFNMTSFGKSGKFVGEFDNVIETTITAVDGSYGAADKFLSFYLGTNDYGDLNTSAIADTSLVNALNFFDYILIDDVKIGTLWAGQKPSEQFFGVWSRKGSFSTRWPASIKATADSAKKITFLAGCQFPSATDLYGTVYELKEDVTFIRMDDGSFANEALLIKNGDLTISNAIDAGEQAELYSFEIQYANWSSARDSYDFNYFGDQFLAMRKNILINGVSLYDINTNTNDSAYEYFTSPWTNDSLAPNSSAQLFQNPTLIRGVEDTLIIYVHKQYLVDTNATSLEVTVKKGFIHSESTQYAVSEDIKATVWVKPVTLKVITGNQRLDPTCVTTYEYAPGTIIESLEAPTAVGKTFAGWVDVNSEAVTFPLTLDESTAIYASWNVESYTVTIKQDGQEDQSFTFGVETVEGIDCPVESVAFALNSYLPANNEDYTYAWAEEVPATFELKDYTFTVVAMEVPKYIEVSLNLGDNEIAIPAGKYATSYVYAMGDYVVNWTGDAIVTLGGMPVENGAKVTLANPMLNMNGVVITPVDATVDCTVVMTIAEYKAPVVELVLGENVVKVTVEGNFCAGTEVEFTAAKAGTYVLKVVDGEENADFTLIEENEATWIEVLPYEFELAEGETIKFLVCTTAIMTLTEDEINFVIEEKADEPIIPDSSEEESSEESSEDVSSEEESSDDVTSEESSEDVSKTESSEEASDSASESESSDSLLAGCFGSVSGLGVAALGLAAVVLFKKKED